MATYFCVAFWNFNTRYAFFYYLLVRFLIHPLLYVSIISTKVIKILSVCALKHISAAVPFLSDQILIDRQYRSPTLFTHTSLPIPNFRNRDTFRMNSVDMTYERPVQHPQDEIRGLSWRETFSLWHNAYAISTVNVRYKPFGAIHFTLGPTRRYPTRLCHWTNFHRLHQRVGEISAWRDCDRLRASK